MHTLTYMFPFLFVGMGWWRLLLIGVQHFVQDRTGAVVWLMRKTDHARFAEPPMGPWSIVVTDNILHILWIAGVAALPADLGEKVYVLPAVACFAVICVVTLLVDNDAFRKRRRRKAKGLSLRTTREQVILWNNGICAETGEPWALDRILSDIDCTFFVSRHTDYSHFRSRTLTRKVLFSNEVLADPAISDARVWHESHRAPHRTEGRFGYVYRDDSPEKILEHRENIFGKWPLPFPDDSADWDPQVSTSVRIQIKESKHERP